LYGELSNLETAVDRSSPLDTPGRRRRALATHSSGVRPSTCAQFGCGFGCRNLFQMRAFHLARADLSQTLSAISAIAATADQRLQTA